jgi:DNA adenine methylase
VEVEKVKLAGCDLICKCRAMKLNATPLRYPGGKGKLTGFVRRVFEENDLLDGHYVEPYAGGAGLALNLLMLDYASCIHLNDLSPSVHAFWDSVLNAPEKLCRMIRDVKLTMEEWRKQKQIQREPGKHSKLKLGFSTFFLNRTNRSGILTGGVIGGNDQTGEWKIDARFNKKELIHRIEKIAFYRARIRLYNLDAAKLITEVLPTLPTKSLVYLDPPYFVKADRLYVDFYKEKDHQAIANLVRKITLPWIVSYDHMPAIVAMYKAFPTITYGMGYSAAKCYEGSEVMFFSKKIVIPKVKSPLNLEAA